MFGALLWKLCEFRLAHKICAELSTGFVLIVSEPREDQSKSNIAFGNSYLYYTSCILHYFTYSVDQNLFKLYGPLYLPQANEKKNIYVPILTDKICRRQIRLKKMFLEDQKISIV